MKTIKRKQGEHETGRESKLKDKSTKTQKNIPNSVWMANCNQSYNFTIFPLKALTFVQCMYYFEDMNQYIWHFSLVFPYSVQTGHVCISQAVKKTFWVFSGHMINCINLL